MLAQQTRASADVDPVTIEESVAADSTATTVKSYAHESAGDELVAPIEDLIGDFKMAAADGASDGIRQLFLLPSAGIDQTTGKLEGVVATLGADAPAAPLVDTELLGFGTTWLRVTGADGAPVNDAAIVKRHAPLGDEHPGMRVALVSGDEYPAKAHYVVVEGNDRAAAAALAERARTATVEELVQGPLAADYQALLASSYDRRVEAAGAFMERHNLDVDRSYKTGNHYTHYVEHVKALSRAAQSSRQRADNTFVAYMGASDPSTSHAGVMVYRGPIAGYTMARARESSTVKGAPSWAWSNAPADGSRPFSMFSASTGVHVAKSGRAADRHKHSSDAVRAAHAERVCWAGSVRSYNPRADLRYHATNDLHWISMASKLGAPPGGAVETTTLDTVVAEVEGIETEAMSLDELADVLANSEESEVRCSTAAAIGWLHAADADTKTSMRLADVFARQNGDVVVLERDVVERLHAVVGKAQ